MNRKRSTFHRAVRFFQRAALDHSLASSFSEPPFAFPVPLYFDLFRDVIYAGPYYWPGAAAAAGFGLGLQAHCVVRAYGSSRPVSAPTAVTGIQWASSVVLFVTISGNRSNRFAFPKSNRGAFTAVGGVLRVVQRPNRGATVLTLSFPPFERVW